MTKYTLLFIVLSFLFAANIHAASLEFASGSGEFQAGKIEQIDVLVRSPDNSINALEGTVVFSAVVAQLVEIKTGSSIVSFWVDKPTQAGNRISFSGVIPGGFQGDKGHLFSLIVLMKDGEKKSGQFLFDGVKVLLNDGLGTPDVVVVNPLTFSLGEEEINKADSASEEEPSMNDFLEVGDIELPEIFVPLLSNDQNLSNGQHVLVFFAQDKGSGISHYEVFESSVKVNIDEIIDGWEVQKSPYVLKDQTLSGYVYIKAVDNQGNERIVAFPSEEVEEERSYTMWIIGALALIIIIVLLKIVKNKHEK